MNKIFLDSPPDSNKDLPASSGKDISPSSALPDNWDDAVDVGKSSPCKTARDKNIAIEGDDEDEEQEDSVPELEKSKSRPKKNVEAANKIKKEHINLVIIGHVGKSLVLLVRFLLRSPLLLSLIHI